MNPRFSIVIPTRERAHTLRHTLATCCAQQGDCEIVVSDNFSSSCTRDVVESVQDARVRYVRTPSLLAMTDSLEFAVSHARGEYVIVQGDDDGLMACSLKAIDEFLTITKAAVLRWDCAVYNWPDVTNAHFKPNRLLLPLLQKRMGHELRVCDSRKMIHAAANGDASYTELPVIYNAAVDRRVIARLIKANGRVFKTCTPDVYAAFALASQVREYHSIKAPLSICGRSGASTGVARHFCKKGSSIDLDFRRLNAEAGYDLHPQAPDLPPICAAVADAFLWARQELLADDPEVGLDRTLLIRRCLAELEIDSDDEWRDIREACRRSLADAPELIRWFEAEYGTADFRKLPRADRSQDWKQYTAAALYLDLAKFGCQDISRASEICEWVLGYAQDGVSYSFERCSDEATSLTELQEKERVIQSLKLEVERFQELENVRKRRDQGWIGALRSYARRLRSRAA